jgi:hypothetical protein
MNISKKEIRQAVHVLQACLHHPDADDAIAMLQGLLDQPECAPVAFTPITADMVTDVMYLNYCKTRQEPSVWKSDFAAAVNAYLEAKK